MNIGCTVVSIAIPTLYFVREAVTEHTCNML